MVRRDFCHARVDCQDLYSLGVALVVGLQVSFDNFFPWVRLVKMSV
jgi:hypothetical protein